MVMSEFELGILCVYKKRLFWFFDWDTYSDVAVKKKSTWIIDCFTNLQSYELNGDLMREHFLPREIQVSDEIIDFPLCVKTVNPAESYSPVRFFDVVLQDELLISHIRLMASPFRIRLRQLVQSQSSRSSWTYPFRSYCIYDSFRFQ